MKRCAEILKDTSCRLCILLHHEMHVHLVDVSLGYHGVYDEY